jgi:hypothetical protein
MTSWAVRLNCHTPLVEKRCETLPPLNPRISTITSMGSRNVRARSGRIRIPWNGDSSILGLTRGSFTGGRSDIILAEAEGDTPEVVR